MTAAEEALWGKSGDNHGDNANVILTLSNVATFIPHFCLLALFQVNVKKSSFEGGFMLEHSSGLLFMFV